MINIIIQSIQIILNDETMITEPVVLILMLNPALSCFILNSRQLGFIVKTFQTHQQCESRKVDVGQSVCRFSGLVENNWMDFIVTPSLGCYIFIM